MNYKKNYVIIRIIARVFVLSGALIKASILQNVLQLESSYKEK